MTGDSKKIETKIFDHYTRQLRERMVGETRVDKYEGSVVELENCISEVENRLKIKLKADGICTTLLIEQLSRHCCQKGEIFGDKVEYYNSSEILDLIELIEEGKVKLTEPSSFFNNIPLKGLSKIHHGAYSGHGYSLVLNVCKYWFKKKGTLRNERRSDFEAIIRNTGAGNFAAIAQLMHTKAVMDKESKLTGEWLIIYKGDRKNYYLCLATHDEGDQNIFDNKIKKCINEFPTELKEIAER